MSLIDEFYKHKGMSGKEQLTNDEKSALIDECNEWQNALDEQRREASVKQVEYAEQVKDDKLPELSVNPDAVRIRQARGRRHQNYEGWCNLDDKIIKHSNIELSSVLEDTSDASIDIEDFCLAENRVPAGDDDIKRFIISRVEKYK